MDESLRECARARYVGRSGVGFGRAKKQKRDAVSARRSLRQGDMTGQTPRAGLPRAPARPFARPGAWGVQMSPGPRARAQRSPGLLPHAVLICPACLVPFQEPFIRGHDIESRIRERQRLVAREHEHPFASAVGRCGPERAQFALKGGFGAGIGAHLEQLAATARVTREEIDLDYSPLQLEDTFADEDARVLAGSA